jgi:hypothetical protein
VKDEWLQTPVEVRGAVEVYFKNQVSSSNWERLKLDGVVFSTLTEEDNIGLVGPFLLEKIERR